MEHRPLGIRFKPNELGYDGIVDCVENPALEGVIAPDSHLIFLNGKDVRNFNFDLIEELLEDAELP